MKNFWFTPVSIGLLFLSLIPAAFWPIPTIFFDAFVTVCLLTKPARAPLAPLLLALFPRLWNGTSFSIAIVTVSIGLALFLFCVRGYREISASGSERLSKGFQWEFLFLLAIALCFCIPVLAIVYYPDPFVEFKDKWLFDGKLIAIDRLPWYYLPRWLSITTPIFFQITTLLGFVSIFFQYKKSKFIFKYLALFIAFQWLFLIAIVLLYPSLSLRSSYVFSVIYNMAILSSIGLIWIFDLTENRHVRILIGVFISIQLLPMFLDISALYPYQGNYFNRAYGGLKVARAKQELYPTDREGIEWLSANIPIGASALVVKPYSTIDRSDRAKDNNNNSRPIQDRTYYKVIGITDNDLNPESNCAIIHTIYRQKTPIVLVKKCP